MTDNVLERLVSKNKLPVLFIGSGISKRYLYKYPNWNELLEMAFRKYNKDIFQLQKHIDLLSRSCSSPFEVNIKLASIIENEFNEAFFDRKFRLPIGYAKNPAWVRKGISPFKMYLSYYFKKVNVCHTKNLDDELSKFRQLKSKVSAILTTNYDMFLEQEVFPNDYTVFVNQSDLFGADSYNIAEIYKIHGSASDANSIVITEQDYSKFNASRKLIIAKMLTLFAESPIIFLGYSFTDENIQNIIADFLSCLSQQQLKNIREHFIFISYEKGQQELIEIQRTITTTSGSEIPITEITTDNFGHIYDILNQITPGVSPVKVRETKRIIKTIIDASMTSTQAESIIVGIDDLSEIDLSSKPLAIAVGYKENILNKFGYGMMDDEYIIEDILYDNKHLNPDSMCIDRFKSLPRTRLLPVFKYVKGASALPAPDSKLAAYIELHDTIEKIITNKIIKTLKNVPIFDSYEELQKAIATVPDVNKKAGLLLKSIQSFSLEEIRELCQTIFCYDKDAAIKATNFKRCVMCLDLLEYCPKEKSQ